MYRLIPNPRRADAWALARADGKWAAPVLWRSEVRNALARHMRAGHITAHEAETAIRLGQTCLLAGEHSVSDQVVFDLVERSNCSAYDCEYVSLAEALGTILVTEDQKLLRAFPKRCRSIAQVL
jgi:predicted nucleic acid-binding protein